MALGGEVWDVAVVCKNPFAVLKRMAIEDCLGALSSFADVGKNGLGRHHSAESVEDVVVERCRRRAGDMRRAIDVVSHAPAVRMGLTLGAEGVVRGHE